MEESMPFKTFCIRHEQVASALQRLKGMQATWRGSLQGVAEAVFGLSPFLIAVTWKAPTLSISEDTLLFESQARLSSMLGRGKESFLVIVFYIWKREGILLGDNVQFSVVNDSSCFPVLLGYRSQRKRPRTGWKIDYVFDLIRVSNCAIRFSSFMGRPFSLDGQYIFGTYFRFH